MHNYTNKIDGYFAENKAHFHLNDLVSRIALKQAQTAT